MVSEIEYALLAGASYLSTRDPVNHFPVPNSWSENVDERRTRPSGFEATYFTKGSEIVISYAGTYAKDTWGDIAADIGLGTGTGSVQLVQAVEYYLQVKAANPSGPKGSESFDFLSI